MYARIARRTSPRVLFLALPLFVIAACNSGPEFYSPEAQAAIAEIKELDQLRVFEEGVFLGEEWAEAAPEIPELRAWYVSHLTRNSMREAATPVAEALMEDHPNSPWSKWALALAIVSDEERRDEALALSEELVAAHPDNLDFVRLRADLLRDWDAARASLDFIDGLPPEQQNTAVMWNRRGVAIYRGQRQDSTLTMEDAFAAHAKARELDPTNVDAHFIPAANLMNQRRLDESADLMATALELSPRSPDIRRYHWRSITSRRDLTAEEKREAVDADVEILLAFNPESPAAIFYAASQYEQMELEEPMKELQDRLLEISPDGFEAEWIHVNRYRAVRSEMYELTQAADAAREAGNEAEAEALEAEREALRPGYREMLTTFLARENPHRPSLLGDAYRNMYYELREDDDVDPEYLKEVVDGLVELEGINTHITHAAAPITLAEETDYHDEALDIVLSGFQIVADEGERYREMGVFDSEGEWDESIRYQLAGLYDALGWIHYQAGRVQDAEHLLAKATQISKRQTLPFYHLGQVYEHMYDESIGGELDDASVRTEYYALAEDAYMTGIGIQSIAENPSDEALKLLYEKRYGSLDGFDVYLADFELRDAQRRRQDVLDERLEDPQPHPVFALFDLEGSELTSADLEGKTVVVNFWGVWCGPCVAEMPDIQKFHAEHEDNSDVVFLTINNDEDPDKARAYMEKNGFTFPVLLDDGYARESEVTAYPTTWFISPTGHIEFSKKGWSEKLVEEFQWRVEAIQDLN